MTLSVGCWFPQGETLETITTATVCLFSAQPQLADQVPPLGHLPKIVQAMNHKNNAIPKSAIRVLHILSDNEVRNRRGAGTAEAPRWGHSLPSSVPRRALFQL